jgi:tRNA U34 2-thiouridine synthase MnmA/TrmU
MKKLLLSALIGITSLTTVGEAKANLSDDYNMDSYVKKTCMESVRQGQRSKFFVNEVNIGDNKKVLNFYQVYGKNVYYVGATTYERGKGITNQTTCKDVKFKSILSKVEAEYISNQLVSRIAGIYVPGYYQYTQWEVENNTQELVKYVKPDEGKTERTSYPRYDIFAQSLQ